MSSSSTETRSTVVDVLMPQMGTSIVEGTIVKWNKAVGDSVVLDEAICEIATDKVETECPAPAHGVLAEILVQEGENVPVGTPLARIDPRDGSPAREGSPAPEHTGDGEPRRQVSSPVARRLAAEHGVDLSDISGTGRGGRVTKRDVLARIERDEANGAGPVLHSDSPYREPTAEAASELKPSAAAPAGLAASLGGVAAPLSRTRQSIAAAMVRSQQIAATVHTAVECDMSMVQAQREELGVTPLAVVARATVRTLQRFADLNAWLDAETIVRFDRVHLGIAVSLGRDGLIVPVIRDAQLLSEHGLAAAIKDLAARARSKKLAPDEARGATFTITSPGAAGAALATPVINLPEVAILDLEAITRRPVVVTDSRGSEALAIRSMANLILGWDHRVVDGMYAAEFLTALRLDLEGRA